MNLNLSMKTYQSLLLFSLIAAMIVAGNFTDVLARDRTDNNLDKAADTYNQKKSKDNLKVVCKREAPIGSRIKKRVCRTVGVMNNNARDVRASMRKQRTSVGPQQ